MKATINELKAQNNLINSTIQILENEKSRHLEQNVEEKESLQKEIDNLLLEHDNSKKQHNSYIKENSKLLENINKV